MKRIDPATNAIAEVVAVGGGPAQVALGAGAVWVTSRRAGTVTRIDPRDADSRAVIRVGGSPQGVAVAGGAVWVAVQAGASPVAPADGEADVLRVVHPRDFLSTDPADSGFSPQFTSAACALLVNYPDRPFPAGAQHRPEVAAALPSVSDDGHTYRFRLRSGFRFSPPSGAPVTAAAFERALERALHRRVQKCGSG